MWCGYWFWRGHLRGLECWPLGGRSDVRLIEFGGSAGTSGELDGYRVPNELPIHVETMLADSRHRAVAHLHPPAVVAADLAGIAIRPIYGAYDIPGAWLARRGVPVYKRAVLIRNSQLGKEMVAAMHGGPVVICRGHGITSAGPSIQEAVLQAISLDTLARMSLRVRAAGGTLRDIDDSDWDDLPDLGSGFNTEAPWRHEVARSISRVDRQSPWPPDGCGGHRGYWGCSTRHSHCAGAQAVSPEPGSVSEPQTKPRLPRSPRD